jgi:hypothetical protein
VRFSPRIASVLFRIAKLICREIRQQPATLVNGGLREAQWCHTRGPKRRVAAAIASGVAEAGPEQYALNPIDEYLQSSIDSAQSQLALRHGVGA